MLYDDILIKQLAWVCIDAAVPMHALKCPLIVLDIFQTSGSVTAILW